MEHTDINTHNEICVSFLDITFRIGGTLEICMDL